METNEHHQKITIPDSEAWWRQHPGGEKYEEFPIQVNVGTNTSGMCNTDMLNESKTYLSFSVFSLRGMGVYKTG